MFKSETTSNFQNDQCDGCFDISSLKLGFVSDFGFRISNFPQRRRGFSFTEIMFAVVILGIGFIMVAAIFPVALQQSKSTAEEINAAGIARGAAHYAGQVFSDDADPNPLGAAVTNLPATGIAANANRPQVMQIPVEVNPVNPLVPSAWAMLRGSMLMTEDPRYAYVMLYRRDGDRADNAHVGWASYAQIYVFPVQVRNKETFTSLDTDLLTAPSPLYSLTAPTANLMAHPVRVLVCVDDTGTSLIAFDLGATASALEQSNVRAAAEGAYVVIADDKIAPPAGPQGDNRGRMNGRIYKLGVRRQDMDEDADTRLFGPIAKVVYELAPDNEFVLDPGPDGVIGDLSNMADPYRLDNVTAIGKPCAKANLPDSPGDPSTVTVTGTAGAFVIGRGYVNPIVPPDAPPDFDGPAMPISAYTTFVKVR